MTGIQPNYDIGYWDGYIALPACTYVSATSFTTATDLSAVLSVGDKIKLTQTTAKYFYITSVSGTTVSVTGGIDYTLANAAITSPFYSKMASPVGFPHYFNYTPTLTGGTGGIATSYRFYVIGRTCFVNTQGSGAYTSNATTFTASLPITAATVSGGTAAGTGVGASYDNGTFGGALVGIADIVSAATTVTYYRNIFGNGSNWTAASQKAWYGTFSYQI